MSTPPTIPSRLVPARPRYALVLHAPPPPTDVNATWRHPAASSRPNRPVSRTIRLDSARSHCHRHTTASSTSYTFGSKPRSAAIDLIKLPPPPIRRQPLFVCTTTATFGQLPRTSSRHQQCSATITATKAATLPHHPHTKDGIASVLINATRIISKTAVTASCDKPSTSLPAVLTPSSASPALFTAAAAVHGPQVKVSSSADRIALAQTKLMTNMPPPPPPLRSQDTSPDGGADARSQVICHPAL
ncbi:uncharacterized protein PSFLO_07712 [Pseudozyma flocculosa]|uniref:Uncharacterized protein n=1 Tax=Pseudozyma flocculosa TaxID=84751 RepID=A0A5C3FFU5_9BASI|nr:uncharacterized protein PSFLO_07711 [Pseudozyma flocculosa]SPO42229.1 uncharacterized protein PSFLO_07712 [Pseudozyma flocculosa]